MTGKSAEEAIEKGLLFGFTKDELEGKIKTMDSYLINDKGKTDKLCVDEFPMSHIAKVDAAVALSKPKVVRLFGDGKQIPWDVFCEGFDAKHGSIRPSISRKQVTFKGETHRNNEDVCAVWVGEYPSYYPCRCCRVGERDRPTMRHHKIASITEVPYDLEARYHGYKKEDRDGIKEGLEMPGSVEDLRRKRRGGLATVAQDQGTTHKRVITVRTNTVWDKNSAKRTPSLYNRVEYVLTDTTRHTESYDVYTLCDEVDLVEKSVALSRDPARLAAVRNHVGIREVDVLDLVG